MNRLASRTLIWAGLAALAAAALSAVPAWADSPLPQTGGSGTTPSDIATLLAPMLAASLGIERLLEAAWNAFENLVTQAGAWIGLGKEWATYARNELKDAQAAFATAVQTRAGDDELKKAADALFNAQSNLRAGLDSDRYKSFKQVFSLGVGMVLGSIVCVAAGIDMLQELHIISSATLLSEIFTGIIVGTGSAPVHSLIGLLQQSRDAVDQAANMFNKRAITDLQASAQQQLAPAPAAPAGQPAPAAPPAPAGQPAAGLAGAPTPAPVAASVPVEPSPAQAFRLSQMAKRTS